jgi:glyoxylase-like metal-dependent hydrolase (beta-lactamase superfamily II)
MSTFSRREALAAAGLSAAALALPRAARAQAAASPPAPPAPPSRPGPAQDQGVGYYRFKVGSLDALALSDGQTSVSPAHPLFAPEGTPEEVRKTLEEVFHPGDRVSIEFNILAVKAAEGWVLFDAGFGVETRGPTLGRLTENLAAAGLKPADIAAVVISHAHGDHLAGVLAAGKPAFPNARVLISKAEHDFWMNASVDQINPAQPAEQRQGAIDSTRKNLDAIRPKLELIAPGDKLFKQIEFVDTTGHTPGHLSAIIADGNASLCAMGDLAHNHVLMFARPEWTVGFDVSPKAAVAARKKMFDRLAADRTRVFAFHLPWPGLGRIGKHGEGYWWAQEPWSWKAS